LENWLRKGLLIWWGIIVLGFVNATVETSLRFSRTLFVEEEPKAAENAQCMGIGNRESQREIKFGISTSPVHRNEKWFGV
jgi:hypothetical protein